MANLIDLLQGQLTEGLIENLADQLGGAKKEQTQAAANGIFSTLVTALSKNAATEEGAKSLVNALDQDHDGGILEDALGFLSGQVKPQNERTTNGAGIVKHILGGKQGGVIDMISKMSGLDSNQSGSLMMKLAPMVMGMLGKTKKQDGLDIGDLVGMLSGSVKSHANDNAQMSLISQLIDKDDDGSILDDIADMGMGFLGKLLRKK